MSHSFRPRKLDYDAVDKALRCGLTDVNANDHPLKAEEADGGDGAVAAAGGGGPTSSSSRTASPAPNSTPADDPLSLMAAADPLAAASTAAPADPLSLAAGSTGTGPLGAPAAGTGNAGDAPAATGASGGPGSTGHSTGGALSGGGGVAGSTSVTDDEDSFVPWAARKSDILSRYTANESIGVSVSFMEGVGGKPNLPVDQVKQRLDELSEQEQKAEESKEARTKLTQADYVAHIERLQSELIRAWDAQERVKSLKIAIQCAKVLGDTNVIQFYPSKFVLITEILDTFGTLVYNRIRNRAGATNDLQQIEAPEEFAAVAGAVSVAARETCRNWQFKIASIRELLPRIYVETAILACYRFTQAGTLPRVVHRLSRMIRGVGDPLVAAHARAYLARATRVVCPDFRDHLLPCYSDLLTSLGQVTRPAFTSRLRAVHRLSLTEYMELFAPALDYLVQATAHRADSTVIDQLMEQYARAPHGVLLASLLSSLPPAQLAARALALSGMIRALPTEAAHVPDESAAPATDGRSAKKQKKDKKASTSKKDGGADDDGEADSAPPASDVYPRHTLYATLGVNLVMGAPPGDQVLTILNDVWKSVTKIEQPDDYVTVAEAWIEYPLRFCSPKEVNILLGDLLAHVLPNRAFERLSGRLSSIVQKVLTAYPSLRDIMSMKIFLPVLDLFEGEAHNEVSKAILFAFSRESRLTARTAPGCFPKPGSFRPCSPWAKACTTRSTHCRLPTTCAVSRWPCVGLWRASISGATWKSSSISTWTAGARSATWTRSSASWCLASCRWPCARTPLCAAGTAAKRRRSCARALRSRLSLCRPWTTWPTACDSTDWQPRWPC